MNKWINENLDIKDNSSLEFFKNDMYTAQASIIELVNPFKGQNLFGNFDLIITVFDKDNKAIEQKEIIGLNGNIKQAKNRMNKLKLEIENKYFS